MSTSKPIAILVQYVMLATVSAASVWMILVVIIDAPANLLRIMACLRALHRYGPSKAMAIEFKTPEDRHDKPAKIKADTR